MFKHSISFEKIVWLVQWISDHAYQNTPNRLEMLYRANFNFTFDTLITITEQYQII